ncbi:MAG: hypothetical protein P8182_11950, partial [Deltaproteobacteria bacterium]
MNATLRIGTVAVLCGLFMLTLFVQANAQGGAKTPVQEQIAKTQSTILEGSKKVMDGAKVMSQALKMMKARQDLDKAG